MFTLLAMDFNPSAHTLKQRCRGYNKRMDTQALHKQLSKQCFNETWTLLDTPNRTSEQNRLMREMAHASLFHWLKRDDCTPQTISVGLWQISRVHAVLGESDVALRYAKDCIAVSEEAGLEPFYVGYAYEAAARAAKDDLIRYEMYLSRSKRTLREIVDDSNRKLLALDLAFLEKDN